MNATEHSRNDAAKQVDRLIEQHMSEQGETVNGESPVAAISTSDRFSWAKQAGVEVDFIDRRVAKICDEIKSDNEHWAVPRYRIKSNK